jgi:hypothetical protein
MTDTRKGMSQSESILQTVTPPPPQVERPRSECCCGSSCLFFLIVKYNSYRSENWYVGRSYQDELGAD